MDDEVVSLLRKISSELSQVKLEVQQIKQLLSKKERRQVINARQIKLFYHQGAASYNIPDFVPVRFPISNEASDNTVRTCVQQWAQLPPKSLDTYEVRWEGDILILRPAEPSELDKSWKEKKKGGGW